MRPLIGISTYARAGERPCFSVPCTYVDAVVAAGGIPVLLPPVGCAATVLEGLGGLLLPGGGDVTPDHYGGAPHAANYDVCAERDAFELALVREALERDLPLLAICRGHQVLNVAAGGTLIQDIPSQVAGAVAHDPEGESWALAHSVRIEPGTRLHRILERGLHRERV